MQGYKTGGHTAGAPNKRTADLAERLEVLGCDPLEGLAKIDAHPTTDTALRTRVCGDLLRYLYPMRKALEVSGHDRSAIEINTDQTRDRVMRKLLPEWG